MDLGNELKHFLFRLIFYSTSKFLKHQSISKNIKNLIPYFRKKKYLFHCIIRTIIFTNSLLIRVIINTQSYSYFLYMKKNLTNKDILERIVSPNRFLKAIDDLVDAKYQTLPGKIRDGIKVFVKSENMEQIWNALDIQIKIIDDHSGLKRNKKDSFSIREWL